MIFELLNVLISEAVAPSFQVKTPHFILGKVNRKIGRKVEKQIGLASKNFRDPNKEYIYGSTKYFPYCSLCDNFEYLKHYFIILNDYEKFIDYFLSVISYQIYINLNDIAFGNTLFEKIRTV